MTKLKVVILCAVLSLSLAACGTGAPSSSQDSLNSSAPPAVSESPAASPDLTDLDRLTEDYLAPAFFSAMTAKNWDSPALLPPDSFVKFYVAKEMPPERDLDKTDTLPAAELEAYIQQYFNVPTDLLRKAEAYDPAGQFYTLGYLGGGASAKVVSAEMDGDTLLLQYEYYSPADETTVIRTGLLSLQFGNEGYRYISCHTQEAASGT